MSRFDVAGIGVFESYFPGVRVLVLGTSGQLGSAILGIGSQHGVIAPVERIPVDSPGAIGRALEEYRPDVLVNCTAFNQIDAAESEPERAFLVNALAVDAMARACREQDIIFVTVGTDYVFDGEKRTPYRENDAPRPLSTYGISKYAGELLAARLPMKHFIVRTSGLYGDRVSTSKGYTFIDRILSQARAGEPVRVVDDLIFSPTYAAHLASAILALLETQAYGLYHAVNEGAVSWYDFACEALRQANIDVRIEPIQSTSWPSTVRRPAYSALSIEKLQALGITMPPWQDGISAYLSARTGTIR